MSRLWQFCYIACWQLPTAEAHHLYARDRLLTYLQRGSGSVGCVLPALSGWARARAACLGVRGATMFVTDGKCAGSPAPAEPRARKLTGRAVALAMFLLLGSAIQAEDGGWRQKYHRDFEQGVRRAQLSDVDEGYFLRSLTGEVPRQADGGPTHVEALASQPGIHEISAKIAELRQLAERLQRRYRLRVPRNDGGDYVRVEDPDAPPAPVDRVLASWRLLRDTASTAPLVPADRPPIAGRRSAPPTWRQPIRIATTGNMEHDALVAEVLQDLRRSVPGLPIDDRSFPNPVERSNVFLDWRGVRCPIGAPCRPHDLSADLRAASARYRPNAAQLRSLHALAFFGELRSGRWVPQAEIIALNAHVGMHVTAAWLRTDQSGGIVTAVCTLVTGLGTGTAAARPSRPDPSEIRQSIRSCLGASMGAPSTTPQWSVRMVPAFRSLCCAPAGAQPAAYSQANMLRQIYR